MTSILRNHELFTFLKERHTKHDKDVCFTGMGGEAKGRWHISNEEYPKFYDLLYDYLFVQRGKPLNLVERPRTNESKPLMIDIDFHYSNETNKIRRFEQTHIFNFTKHIGEALTKFLDLNNYETLRFFITMRAAPYPESKNQFIKDGIHILCPDIALKNEKQKVLRNYILQEGYLKDCFENTGYINKEEDVYDAAMTRDQAWFPYGESKPSITPYLLNNVFIYKPTENILEESDHEYTNRELLQLLSIRYDIPDDYNEIRPEEKDTFNLLLQNQVIVHEEPSALNMNEFINMAPNEQEKSLISRLVLECLDKGRADSREDWMRVGWCLHNIEESEDMFNLWMDFSKFSPKFSSNDINQLKVNFLYKMRTESDRPRQQSEAYIIGQRKTIQIFIKKLLMNTFMNMFVRKLMVRIIILRNFLRKFIKIIM